MDQREPHQLSYLMVGVNLGDRDLIVGGQPPRDVDRAHRHIKKERRAQLGVVRPLRHRLEVVHRLAGFDLDNADDLPALVGRKQDGVRIFLARRAQRNVLFGARVDAYLDLPPAEVPLELANHAVVLELFTYGPHQDRTQRGLRLLDRLTKPHTIHKRRRRNRSACAIFQAISTHMKLLTLILASLVVSSVLT